MDELHDAYIDRDDQDNDGSSERTRLAAGASVMNGSSRTLDEIGFVDYLKSGQHPWKNLHADILAEENPVKQAELRKQSVLSDFYLGGVHAIVATGELVVASNSGSQLPHLVYTSLNLILVVGTQKITSSLDTTITTAAALTNDTRSV